MKTTGEEIGVEAAEAVLRRIAALEVPEGLEDRIAARLKTAAQPRQARILRWPSAAAMENSWMRAAAAAAIVCVVAGGGWGLARQLGNGQEARQEVVPQAAPAPAATGGFATGSAMRTPKTVEGPVVKAPPMMNAQALPEPKAARTARKTGSVKPPAKDGAAVKPVEPAPAEPAKDPDGK